MTQFSDVTNVSSTPSDRQKIKVAFCITELDVGGAERCLVELACGLDPRRFESIVLVLAARPIPPGDSLYRRLEEANVPVISLRGRSKLGGPLVLWRLSRQLRAFRPDILQTFLWHANFLGRLAALLSGVPHVVSGIRVAEKRSRWRLRLDRWTDRWVTRHVAVSKSVAEFSRDVGGLPESKIAVIPNGVDLRRFENVAPAQFRELALPVGSRTILYVGRLDPQKRVDWLLRLLAPLFAVQPDLYLVVVGKGPDWSGLHQLADELEVQDRVRFAGFREDVPALLAASDVLVLPSAWEGMPNVVLEAMASSRPVVATDVEGVRELLGDDWQAQTAPVDEPQTFAARLLALLNSEAQRVEVGGRNRRRAAQFSLEAAIRQYSELYERLCRQC